MIEKNWKRVTSLMVSLLWSDPAWKVTEVIRTLPDTFGLSATRGEWLLELAVAPGLTDEVVLAHPATDSFIRLADTSEFHLVSLLQDDDIKQLWEKRAADRRYGPEGSPTPVEKPQSLQDKLNDWQRQSGLPGKPQTREDD